MKKPYFVVASALLAMTSASSACEIEITDSAVITLSESLMTPADNLKGFTQGLREQDQTDRENKARMLGGFLLQVGAVDTELRHLRTLVILKSLVSGEANKKLIATAVKGALSSAANYSKSAFSNVASVSELSRSAFASGEISKIGEALTNISVAGDSCGGNN